MFPACGIQFSNLAIWHSEWSFFHILLPHFLPLLTTLGDAEVYRLNAQTVTDTLASLFLGYQDNLLPW